MLYVTRVAWFTERDRQVSITLAGDRDLAHCGNHPTMSVLWLRDPDRLHKSITCSDCGISTKAYWSCSDVGCHISLCPRCWNAALYPDEPGLCLSSASGGVGEKRSHSQAFAFSSAEKPYELAPPTSCREFSSPSRSSGAAAAAPPAPLAQRLAPGGPFDRSHVLVPTATVSLLGLGEDQQRSCLGAATHYTKRSEALHIGYGCYPFKVSWAPPTFCQLQAEKGISGTAVLLADTRAERLVIDIRCHLTDNGYLFGKLVYNAHQIIHNLVLPLVFAFHASKEASGSPVAPDDVLILFHCCSTVLNTFLRLLTGVAKANPGVAPHLLLFSTPLLVFDMDSVVPFVVPPFTNRLRRVSLCDMLVRALSADFRDTYHPVLLVPPPVGAQGDAFVYAAQSLADPAPPGVGVVPAAAVVSRAGGGVTPVAPSSASSVSSATFVDVPLAGTTEFSQVVQAVVASASAVLIQQQRQQQQQLAVQGSASLFCSPLLGAAGPSGSLTSLLPAPFLPVGQSAPSSPHSFSASGVPSGAPLVLAGAAAAAACARPPPPDAVAVPPTLLPVATTRGAAAAATSAVRAVAASPPVDPAVVADYSFAQRDALVMANLARLAPSALTPILSVSRDSLAGIINARLVDALSLASAAQVPERFRLRVPPARVRDTDRTLLDRVLVWLHAHAPAPAKGGGAAR